MNKINLKGVTPSMVGSLMITFIALLNVIFSMIGVNPINISDDLVYEIISIVFVLVTTLFSMYKNFNVTTGSQKLQEVLDMLNNGEILVEDIDKAIAELKHKNNK